LLHKEIPSQKAEKSTNQPNKQPNNQTTNQIISQTNKQTNSQSITKQPNHMFLSAGGEKAQSVKYGLVSKE